MRAYRNVNLVLPGGLISLPISLSPVVGETAEPKGKVVGPEGESLTQVYMSDAGEVVDRAATLRDFDGRTLTQDQVKSITEQTKIEDFEILDVVAQSDIDFRRAKSSYFVYSHKKNGNHKAFNGLVQTLAKDNKAAVIKWTPTSRQQLLVLYPEGDALIGTTLAFAEDVKETDSDLTVHQDQEVSEQELDLFGQILSQVEGSDALSVETDALIPLKQKLIAGEAVDLPEKSEAASPDNLLKALQANAEAVQKSAKKGKTKAKA